MLGLIMATTVSLMVLPQDDAAARQLMPLYHVAAEGYIAQQCGMRPKAWEARIIARVASDQRQIEAEADTSPMSQNALASWRATYMGDVMRAFLPNGVTPSACRAASERLLLDDLDRFAR